MVIRDFLLQGSVRLTVGGMPEKRGCSPYFFFPQAIDVIARTFRELVDELLHRLVV
jgi:hypothetical protein